MPLEKPQLPTADEATLPLLLIIRDELANHRHDFADLKRDIYKAFPKNDEGQPDFEQHRRDHVEIKAENKRLEDYKVDFTKKLISWGGIGAMTIICTALVQYFSK